MGVEAQHPDYVDRAPEWRVMRDCMRGEAAIKQALTTSTVLVAAVDPSGVTEYGTAGTPTRTVHASADTYLPMPSGFAAQADGGLAMYRAYTTRAQFPDILAPTLTGMVGLIHRKEAQVTLPTALEGLYERATKDGLSLEAFHRRVTGELLETGRYSILTDVAATGSDLPFLAGYTAETLINWSDDGDLFVLDESGRERSGEFDWEEVRRHRVLRLADGAYTQQVYAEDGVAGVAITPTRRGGGSLDVIPFVVIGSRDIILEVENPPLLGVARSCLALYRLDADYRHQLFMSGQETLFIIGADDAPGAVGAAVVVTLPLGADAKYVGPSGSGIAAHRTAIQDEREAAASAGARLFDARKSGVESGEALRVRFAAQGATLVSVALSSAQGLERALKNAAIMVGANPDEVVVKPDLEFVETLLEPKQAVELLKLWQGGAISYETFYENLQKGGIASLERTSDDEKELIETEPPDVGGEIMDVPRVAA